MLCRREELLAHRVVSFLCCGGVRPGARGKAHASEALSEIVRRRDLTAGGGGAATGTPPRHTSRDAAASLGGSVDAGARHAHAQSLRTAAQREHDCEKSGPSHRHIPRPRRA